MKGAGKWLALVGGFVLCLAVAALIVAFKVRDSARDESRWLVSDMWQAEYFNRARQRIPENEAINILSLRPGASRREKLLTYVASHQCGEAEARCRLNELSSANLLVDRGELDSALNLLASAVLQLDKTGDCAIGVESSLLRYHEAKLQAQSPAEARVAAAGLIVNIRTKGGLMRNLRTDACNVLARQKPDLFHTYVVLVGRVMQQGKPSLFKQGAFIDSTNKLDF
ncbi:hypothetical protein QO207_27710 [Pseudomonas sp. CAN2814]|uniref:hypothetical protein n=1 Tax=Pseudomonas sp. CAN1 TaxID=3046726 RepID=UPI0026472F8E|nr:hypothetical protein [Pseudomonas sp. CAN1]MDN6860394.1 hypothetical protein [Pseudomonas sp. CAN1]